MAVSVFPVPTSKTRKVETLTSGSSWTVPAGVTYVNATLIGGGGGGGSAQNQGDFTYTIAQPGHGGEIISTTVATTPGASISYGIGAGGAGASSAQSDGSVGGNTTFTGATTATGGNQGNSRAGTVGTAYLSANNGGNASRGNNNAGAGGSGCIILEYWV